MTTHVLVLVGPEDPVAEEFRTALRAAPELAGRIDLRFASAENAAAVIEDVEVVTCGVLPPPLIDAARSLKWLAFWSAGLDGKVTQQMRDRSLVITNASGVHGPNIAEHVLAMMLMFTRRMEHHLRSQIEQKWERRMPVESPPIGELNGQTLGIVGLGRIGEALAIRAKAFGMRVLAVKRDPSARYDDAATSAVAGKTVPYPCGRGTGRGRSVASNTPALTSTHNLPNANVDALHTLDYLPQLLAESDHVCIALPYTPVTHHLFDAAMLANMKPTAYIYNIARGAIIDESALIAALVANAIAGAGLDVFEQEPLPAESRLWDMPNVIITPHVAGLTPHYFQRYAELFVDNLGRYVAGEKLKNVYDEGRGY
jgi:D-2-hydroxyacid dehydrogenase (NADP+)